MQKTILITGATDGIGFETAKMLIEFGHNLLLHGRNPAKLDRVRDVLTPQSEGNRLETYVADLSRMKDVEKLAGEVTANHKSLDGLINNAGVFVAPENSTIDGLEVRFAVNTLAPYLLTQKLLPLMDSSGRVINLSSAAQAPVKTREMIAGERVLSSSEAYAQSKLALTMWSRDLALILGKEGPNIISVNPKSFLGSKMVQQAYGTAGSDLRIGADILCKAVLSEEFTNASGLYFDNDIGQFTNPHPDALNERKCREVVAAIKTILNNILKEE